MYRSGTNAAVHLPPHFGQEPLRLWGPAGTVTRVPTAAPKDWFLFGESGPLWVLRDGAADLPAVEKAAPLTAAVVERAGFRLRDVLGSSPTAEIDPARSAGVTLRSVVKVRRHLAPPVYVAVATRGAHGIPQPDGSRSPVTSPTDCHAALAVLDAELETVVAFALLPPAERTCAVPVVAGPVDVDADGTPDVLVHGQSGPKGFRTWYRLGSDGSLTLGEGSAQEAIP